MQTVGAFGVLHIVFPCLTTDQLNDSQWCSSSKVSQLLLPLSISQRTAELRLRFFVFFMRTVSLLDCREFLKQFLGY